MDTDTPKVAAKTAGATVSAEPPDIGARVGAALASTRAILVGVPLLVVIVGVVLSVLGQRALVTSSDALARARFASEARFMGHAIDTALSQTDPVIGRVARIAAAHGPDAPYERVGHELADLLRARPGATYVSMSFPDGTFQGAYLDEDGQVRFQVSRVIAKGDTRVFRFNLAGRDALQIYKEERSDYDPRERVFYKQAVEKEGRIWTEPYSWYLSNTTGITCAEPVYVGEDSNRHLHAVVTLDYDVEALSTMMASAPTKEGVTRLVHTADGTLLAYRSGGETPAQLPAPKGRALTYRDVNDPVLDGLFSHLAGKAPDEGQGAIVDELRVGKEQFLRATQRVGEKDNLDWYVSALVPRSVFTTEVATHERQSLFAGAVALALATVVALSFAAHVARERRDAADARARAREAEGHARELGSYRLVQRIAKGGMGEVWRAEHRLLARQAAIKLIRPDVEGGGTSVEARERFKREARSLAGLRSRNTVEVFDYGVTDDGTFFLVMELLEGIDLDALVDGHGPMPASRVVHMLVQALSSLAEAHDAGLVHRDIKPANLFVARQADEVDVVKMLDFGVVQSAVADEPHEESAEPLAPTTVEEGGSAEATSEEAARARIARLTGVGKHLGTPAYMSPEQANSKRLDARADLYALGCVGWWLLTGKLVFERKDTVSTMIAHMVTPPPPLRPLVPGYLPEALERVVLSCLAKDPDARPADARSLRTALESIVFPPEEAWTRERAVAWWEEHDVGQAPAGSIRTGARRTGTAGAAPRLLEAHIRR